MDDEIAALIGYATVEQRGVGWIEKGDVGVGHGIALLVDDGALVACVGLLYTLYENLLPALVIACRDADGIESYHLSDG